MMGSPPPPRRLPCQLCHHHEESGDRWIYEGALRPPALPGVRVCVRFHVSQDTSFTPGWDGRRVPWWLSVPNTHGVRGTLVPLGQGLAHSSVGQGPPLAWHLGASGHHCWVGDRENWGALVHREGTRTSEGDACTSARPHCSRCPVPHLARTARTGKCSGCHGSFPRRISSLALFVKDDAYIRVVKTH